MLLSRNPRKHQLALPGVVWVNLTELTAKRHLHPVEVKELTVAPHPLAPEQVRQLDAYRRAANYLSVGQIYLYDNPLLNDLDRFHLVIDTIARLPQTGAQGRRLKRRLMDKLTGHKQYINQHGQDLPEIRAWQWSNHP